MMRNEITEYQDPTEEYDNAYNRYLDMKNDEESSTGNWLAFGLILSFSSAVFSIFLGYYLISSFIS